LDGLQGSWKLVSAMRDGEALPKDKVKKTTIVIKDDTFLFPDLAEYATRGGDDQARREDKAKADGCDLDRERSHARHLRTGRRPKVCFAPTGKPRPSEFGSKPGSGNLLQVWKRKKKQ